MSHHTTPTLDDVNLDPKVEIREFLTQRYGQWYADRLAPAPVTYLVSLVSPLLDGPFEVEVVASSESAAIARTRMVAFHQYRHESMLTADCTVEVLP